MSAAPNSTDVAQAWRDTVALNDMPAFRALYLPGARIWTNLDRADHALDDHLHRVADARRRCGSWRYDDVVCQSTEDGFVSEHTVRFAIGGELRSTVAAIVATVTDGRISSLREYLTPAVAPALHPPNEGVDTP